MKPQLAVFVYGTLKKGFSNHELCCSGVSRIQPAHVQGRLFKLSPSIPIMVLPSSEILAVGSGDAATDVALQHGFMSWKEEESICRRTAAEDTAFAGGPEKRWMRINGEVHYFDDPETRLPMLDDFEEFRPGEASTYLRVLVRATLSDGSRAAAWTYVAGFDTSGLEEYEKETWFPDEEPKTP